ncbi:MAG TPA: 3-phosphoshikimate 1-carboxyvinyltransferase [Lachnospiraceae bacterium]|nr:3-phosphoshikimate 1-carboxyvinyltransferase [Lachnospiraceae bacterium]
MKQTIHPVKRLNGTVCVPGDKSISHRAVMFGAIASGDTRISHFLRSADCLSTVSCFRKLGIELEEDPAGETIIVHGRGLRGLREASEVLYTGNSATTTRLISGILAGQGFASTLDGDASIRKRPMKRIMTPLSLMGADIRSLHENGCVPLRIAPAVLHAIDYLSPTASAQVKSCVLLAGLYAEGTTTVTEPFLSRNHTELMLSGLGARVSSRKTENGYEASIAPEPELHGFDITIPGDISSAAYFLAAALIVPGSEVLIKNVGINPTRTGILQAAQRMGGDIRILNQKIQGGEMAADLLVRSSALTGIEVGAEMIPTLIDELPVLAVLAAYASGTTVIRHAAELRVKESDRIETTTNMLRAMGAHITPTPDGMVIEGGAPLHGAVTDSCLDHRIAMSAAVCALAAEGPTTIRDAECIDISYPSFYSDLSSLTEG